MTMTSPEAKKREVISMRGYKYVEKNGKNGRKITLKHDATKAYVEFYVAPRSAVSARCDIYDLESFLGRDDAVGFISHMEVPFAHRRKGIGSRLVRHALRYLEKARVRRVFLIVDVDGEGWLEKFYRQLGFRVVVRARNFGMLGSVGRLETFMGVKL